MKKHLLSILLILLAICPWAHAAGPDEIWEQIKSSASQFEDSPAVILFDHIDTVYKENGSAVTREEMLIHFRESDASSEFRTLNYDYNPRTAHIRFLEVKIFKSDGKTVQDIPLTGVLLKKAPADMIFWNFDMVICPIPRLEKGDALYYRIERRGLNLAYLDEPAGQNEWDRDFVPPQPGYFMDTVYFDDELPIVQKTYTIRGPQSRPLQFATGNGALEASLKFDGGDLVYRFAAKDREAYEYKPFQSDLTNAGLKLAMASHPSWEMKSKWAYEHNEPQFVISPEMQKKVDQIIEGARDDDEKMARLLHWVAEEVRYLGLDMGEGEGHMVHRTDEIFRDLAGVCKDKAAILVSMLRAAGFETYFVLTLAMEQTLDVPADDKFNHGVVAVRDARKGWIFLDPTWAPQNRPLFNHLEQEQPVLVACPEGADLLHIPYSPPEENPLVIHIQSFMDRDGNIRSELELQTDGYPDGRFRESLWMQPAVLRSDILYEFLSTIQPRMNLLDYSISDPMDFSTPMQMNMLVDFPKAAMKAGKNLVLIPPGMRQPGNSRRFSDYLMVKMDPKSIRLPVEIACTRRVEIHEELHLPSGYTLKKLPDPVLMDGPAAKLDFKITKPQSGLVRLDQVLELKKRIIPVSEYGQFKKVIDRVNELRETHLVFESSNPTPRDPQKPEKLSDRYRGGQRLSDEIARIRLNRIELALQEDGGQAERYSRSVTILNETGRDRYSDPAYIFDASNQSVKVIESVTEKLNGDLQASPGSAINITLDESVRHAPDYCNYQTLIASNVGIEYGGTVRSTIERSTRPGAAPFLDYVAFFLEPAPTERLEIEVSSPEGVAINTHTPGLTGIGSSRFDGSTQQTTFVLQNIPAQRMQYDQGPYFLNEPPIIITTYPDWDTAMNTLKSAVFDPDPAVAGSLHETAGNLLEDCQGTRNSLETLVGFVRDNIAPVEIPARRFFYKTRPVSRILETGYGYNLERYKLLAALTESAGGTFEILLWAPPEYISDKAPSLNIFPMTAARLSLDGIDVTTSLDDYEPDMAQTGRYQQAVVTRSDWRWMKPLAADASLNRRTMDLKIRIDEKQNMEGDLLLTYTGLCIPVEAVASGNKQWIEKAAGFIADKPEIVSFDIVRLPEPTRENLAEKQALSAEMRVKFTGKARTADLGDGAWMMEMPGIPEGLSAGTLMLRACHERFQPVRLPYPQTESVRIEVQLPDKSTILALPSEAKSQAASANLSAKASTDPDDASKMLLRKEIKISDYDIPAGDYDRFRNLWLDYMSPETNTLIFEMQKPE